MHVYLPSNSSGIPRLDIYSQQYALNKNISAVAPPSVRCILGEYLTTFWTAVAR